MKFGKINIRTDKKTVLIAPLDWGLGHATRCIPIIYELLQLNCEVIIAAEGRIKKLLQKEFPGLIFIHFRGYNISYSKSGLLLPLKLTLQIPKIMWRIYTEQQQLKLLVKEYKIDAVISDNRLGLYHSNITSVYITHQLKIKTGNSITEWILQKIHYFFINRYTVCWVPDTNWDNNVAGELSHPKQLPKTAVKYLGLLSRFNKIEVEKKYNILAIISGPEPQRTIFEQLLMQELKTFSGSVALVRGLPENAENEGLAFDTESKITIANHLSADELNKTIQQADLVISRSGYTTIMDLIKLQQKAILIPTPGQTEQEYLAEYLMKKNIFFRILQRNFSLTKALQKVADFSFTKVCIKQDEYKEVIKEFAQQLN
jgi:uncharacterized protein (TIGR00661 family)